MTSLRPIVLLLLCPLILSCSQEKAKQKQMQERAEKKAKLAALLQGSWKYVDDTGYVFSIDGKRAVYVHNDKVDPDTLNIALLSANCNPDARYDTMARRLAGEKLFYVNTYVPRDTVEYHRRCFAVIRLSKRRLSLLDTENGTLINYRR